MFSGRRTSTALVQLIRVGEAEAAGIHVGNRCEVPLASGSKARGVVAFVGAFAKRDTFVVAFSQLILSAGHTDLAPGFWVGVKLDEPVGDSNGSVKSRPYFACLEKFGLFARPATVQVGDFPELGLDLSEDEM